MSKHIVIVGGVAGGASAAAKARREDEHAEISIYEAGPFVSFANCGLPYFIGGEIESRDKLLMATPETFRDKYRIGVYVNHEAISIDTAQQTVAVRDDKGVVEHVAYDKLVLSQGAQPVVPPFDGVEQGHVFTLRDIPSMDRIHGYINNNTLTHAVVVGGGFIGLEMAEAFHRQGLSVTVIERAPHILPMLDADVAGEFQDLVERDGFFLRTGIGAKSIESNTVILENNEHIKADIVLLSAGVRPEIALAKDAGLIIGQTGGVKVNGRLESSNPHIYAVGDAAEITHYLTGLRVRIPLAGPANRQGRIAGANAVGKHMIYRGGMGTSIVRVIDQTVAMVGLSVSQAQAAGLSIVTSVTRDGSHAGYYPGATTIVSKLVIEESTGRLLGAQVMGASGVDKRVDVYATAIFGNMTVDDLSHLDLAYSPPFGSANDPVNVAGFVASHMVHGDIRTLSPDLHRAEGFTLLDVRNADEIARTGLLKGAMHIALPVLRNSLDEIPKTKPIAVYCQKGQRGYLATRILMGHGFEDVYNIAGGFLQAKACEWEIDKQ